jgi:hypothetical protein
MGAVRRDLTNGDVLGLIRHDRVLYGETGCPSGFVSGRMWN